MNEKQKEFLAQSGINLTDGLAYFSENERLYEKYLFRFLEEPTFPELFKAIEEDRREDARRAAHSLKGITATLGFTSLHTPLKAQEFEFKNGRWEEGNQYTDELKKEYARIIEVLQAGRTHQKLSNEPRYRSPFIGDLTRGTF